MREHFVQAVPKALTKAGFDRQVYDGHSFKIGAVTTAAHCGIPDSVIQTFGRWQSSAYLLYIRTPQKHLANITSTFNLSFYISQVSYQYIFSSCTAGVGQVIYCGLLCIHGLSLYCFYQYVICNTAFFGEKEECISRGG